MNTIKTNWNLGNFAVSLTTEVTDSQRDELAAFGLLWLGQRQSGVDKALGAFFTNSAGKQERKAKWKRVEVPFSEEMEGKLIGVFQSLDMPDTEAKLPANVTITEYVREEASTKEAEAIAGDKESKGTLDEWAQAHGVGATHTPDGEDFSPELLAAITRKVREVRKAALAAV